VVAPISAEHATNLATRQESLRQESLRRVSLPMNMRAPQLTCFGQRAFNAARHKAA
jgi:hypothetical protein